MKEGRGKRRGKLGGATVRVSLERREEDGETQVATAHGVDAGLLGGGWLAGVPSRTQLLYDFRQRGLKRRKENLRLRSGLWIISFICSNS